MPPYTTLNPLSTAVLFAFPASLGSGVSIYYHGALGWCLVELILRGRAFSRDRLMWIATGFLILYCAANITGYLVNGTSGGSAKSLIQLTTLLSLPFLYSILAISHKDAVAFAAVAGSAVASYFATAYALAQFYIWNMRAEGMDGNALVFAHVVTLAGSLCVAGLALGYGGWRGFPLRTFLAGAIAAALVALVLSGSRTYWLVFPLLAGCILLFCRNRSWRPGWYGVLAGFAAAAVFFVIAYEPVLARLAALGRDWQDVADQGRFDNSLGFRVKLWELAGLLIREHPWVGFGTPSTKNLIETGFQNNPELLQGFSHFHNGFITALVEAGALGLFALLGVLAVAAAGAVSAFRKGSGAAQKLGGVLLLFVLLASLLAGNLTIVIGHDILDAAFMLCLVIGLYLAAGTSMIEGTYEAYAPQQ